MFYYFCIFSGYTCTHTHNSSTHLVPLPCQVGQQQSKVTHHLATSWKTDLYRSRRCSNSCFKRYREAMEQPVEENRDDASPVMVFADTNVAFLSAPPLHRALQQA